MPFTVDKVPDMPAIVFVHRAYDALPEMPAIIARLTEMLDAQTEPVFVISNIGGAAMGEMVKVANGIARGDKPVLRNRIVRENLLVTDTSIVQLASKGLINGTSGWVWNSIFASTREALDYCRGVAPVRMAKDVRVISG